MYQAYFFPLLSNKKKPRLIAGYVVANYIIKQFDKSPNWLQTYVKVTDAKVENVGNEQMSLMVAI